MAKDINSSAAAIAASLERRFELQSTSWRSLRSKLDSVLMATNVLKSNDSMKACQSLDTMTTEQRKAHILRNWGPMYVTKAEPILIQLELLEKQIDKTVADQ